MSIPPVVPPSRGSELTPTGRRLAALIDHTLLKPEATEPQVERLGLEAIEYGFASVCVHPALVRAASRAVAGSPVCVCTVVGFPAGAVLTASKCQEVELALRDGAREIDMVMAIWAAKQGNWHMVELDVRTVVKVSAGWPVKVILETCLLTDEEKQTACRVAVQAGARFVKTSTGCSSGGATEADIRLMRQAVGPDFGVKASGGIRTRETALAMVAAGATRLGTSAGIGIVCATAAT